MIAAAFGSYGWAGGAVKGIESRLFESGIKVAQPGLGLQYEPDAEGLKKCFDFGKEFTKSIQ